MTRIMYDSTNPGSIPLTAPMVAGYVNGPRSQWPASGWDRWTGIPKLRIDVNGTDPYGSDVLDVETGDATIPGAVEWVKTRHARGWWSACYVGQASLAALQQAMGGLNCEYWVAHWGVADPASLLAGRVVAVQYLNDQQAGYDLSVVNDSWFPSPAPVAPPAAPKTTQAQAAAALAVLTAYVEGK
jgi:hypothetical protein